MTRLRHAGPALLLLALLFVAGWLEGQLPAEPRTVELVEVDR